MADGSGSRAHRARAASSTSPFRSRSAPRLSSPRPDPAAAPHRGVRPMAAPPVLLIELLGGVGAHEADAALRQRAMRCAGLPARTLALEPAAAGAPAAAWRAAAARIVAEHPSQVWVAGAHASWQGLARALPPRLPRARGATIVPRGGGGPHALRPPR